MPLSEKIGKLVLYALLILSSLWMLLPFLWMLSSSLKTSVTVFEFPIRWIPAEPRWSNYVEIWRKIDFGLYYFNTIKLTVIITLAQLFTCSLAAYAFAKIDFPERNVLFLGYIATMIVPFQVVMIPQFILMRHLGLVNTHASLILLQAFSPFGVFLMRQYYLNIPNDLLEAARIDGLSEFGIYWRIMLPLSKPALSTLAILTFVFVWNDFLGPLIYLHSARLRTIQLGIRMFISQYSADYALIMAASVCSLIPVVIIFLLAQRYFVEGISFSGLKG
ncbi:MAG TPA: carbohydrate ABC transporter permease [Limnochordia bacterium]|nr:carbohydrate ABC transporter permease [Limnochordia bacterium]